MRQRLSLLLPLCAVLGLLVAAPAHAEPADIAVTEDGFEPAEVAVEVGDTILWRNDTESTVTVVDGAGSWDSGPLEPGETFSLALREPGTHEIAAEGVEGSATIEVSGQATPVATTVADTEASLPDTGLGVPALAGLSGVLLLAGGLTVRSTARRT